MKKCAIRHVTRYLKIKFVCISRMYVLIKYTYLYVLIKFIKFLCIRFDFVIKNNHFPHNYVNLCKTISFFLSHEQQQICTIFIFKMQKEIYTCHFFHIFLIKLNRSFISFHIKTYADV